MLLHALSCFAQLSDTDFEAALAKAQDTGKASADTSIARLEKKFPADGRVKFLRGFYHQRNGDVNAALLSYSQAITAQPAFALSYSGRAWLLEEKGLFEKAMADWDKYLALESGDTAARSRHLKLASRLGKPDLVLTDAEALIALAPGEMAYYEEAARVSGQPEKYFGLALSGGALKASAVQLAYGSYLFVQNQYEPAAAKFKQAYAVAPDLFSAEQLNMYAISLYKLRDYSAAVEVFERAIRSAPRKADYRCNLASVYIDTGDWPQVLRQGLAATEADPSHAIAHMITAIGYMKTGNAEKAKWYEAKAHQLEGK